MQRFKGICLLAGILTGLTVLGTGCGSSSDSAAVPAPPSGERAHDHIQRLLNAGATPDPAGEYEFFRRYRQLHPDDPVGALGYALSYPAYAAHVLATKYGGVALPFPGPRLQDAVSFLAAGAPSSAALHGVFSGLGLLIQPRPYLHHAAALAADIRSIWLPALRESADALAPLTQMSGVIAVFTDRDNQEYALCSEEVTAYRAFLRLSLAMTAAALAYSWDAGSFDWDRTPQELDVNKDGQLTPAEYLPGPPFFTLTDPAALVESASALSGALDDAAAAAKGMLADVDPRQLLARAGQEQPVSWAEVAQLCTALQLTMLGPVPVPLPYWDSSTETWKQVVTPVNLRAFWTSPPRDLRTLVPVLRYKPLGAGAFDLVVDSIPDKTLGGVLPDGDRLPEALWTSFFSEAKGAL